MSAVDVSGEVRRRGLCGSPVERCAGCGNAIAHDLDECPKCHSREREQSTCRQPAGSRTDHLGDGPCWLHTGSTPAHGVAAERRAQAVAARTYGVPRDVDPAVALLEEVCRTAGIVAWLEERVAGLSEDELMWGKTEETVGTSGGTATGARIKREARVHPLVRLYQDERKHLAAVSRDTMQAGVQERMARVSEQLGAMMVSVFRAALADPELGLTSTQLERAEHVVGRHLSVVAA